MDKQAILEKLPPYRQKQTVIRRDQNVADIIGEVLNAHTLFASDYDRIAQDFWTGDVFTTCKKLFDFIRSCVTYKIETEGRQTTRSPAAILSLQQGDCKHYAGFIGGVLDAINRQFRAGISWKYRFASYNLFDRTPGHVFIVVEDRENEIWIDPVLRKFDYHYEPAYYLDKKVKPMSLVRMSGVGCCTTPAIGDAAPPTFPVSPIVDDVDFQSDPALYMAFQRLLKYGILDANGVITPGKFTDAQKLLTADAFQQLIEDWALVHKSAAYAASISGARVGGFFDFITRAFKVTFFATIRGAYLSLVAINAFGYATKLQKSVYNDDGTYTTFKDQIKNLWQDKFGGQWTILENTINQGATHKAILGVAQVAIPVWAATASAIIVALTPIITAALKARQQATGIDWNGLDPTTGLPYGTPGSVPASMSSGSQIMQFLGNNPAILIGGAALGLYLWQHKKHHA